MDNLLQDLRFAVRTLRRSPWFTLVSVLTLALGIGVNAAMWSVADAVLFRDLAYGTPSRMALIWQHSLSAERGSLSIPTFHDVQQRNRSFDALTILKPRRINLTAPSDKPERVQGVLVSQGVLDVMGREPILGRGFVPDDHRAGAIPVVLLSYEIWQQRFGDEEALRQTVLLDEIAYRIIGVLPPGLGQEQFDGTPLGDFWIPVELFRDVLPFEDRSERPSSYVLGRFKEDGGAGAQTDLEGISRQLSEEYPDTFKGAQLRPMPIRDYLNRGDRQSLVLMLGAVLLVLFIACVNLTNLHLSRLARRQQEMATRWALGAERTRLMAQMAIENLVLGLLGGLAGLGLAHLMLLGLPSLLGEQWWVQSLPAVVWGVSLLVAALAGMLVGWLPARGVVRASQQNRFAKMQMRSSLPHKKLRHVLVGTEVALALTTLIWAGLLVGSVTKLGEEDPGFASEGRMTFRMVLPQSQFSELPTWVTFFDEALTELTNMPGVTSAALTSKGPLADQIFESIVAPGDRALPAIGELSPCLYQMVSPSYFETLGIPVLEGRGLLPGDDDRLDTERVVVISKTLADTFWPDTSPIDKTLAFEFLGTPSAPEPQWRRVVGVVDDIRSRNLQTSPGFAVYSSYRQLPEWYRGGASPSMTFVVHSQDLPPGEVLTGARTVLQRVAPTLPVFLPEALEDTIEGQLVAPRRSASLLSVFAVLALVLSVVGVLGVVSYVVTARTREIGTRLTMGASPWDILSIFLMQTLQTVGVGILVGVLVSLGLSRFVSSLLYGLDSIDPLTYCLSALGLMASALLATLLPALRAARLRPLDALRHD